MHYAAKAETWKCNRCRQTTPDPKGWVILRRSRNGKRGNPARYDLCPECSDSFTVFVDHPFLTISGMKVAE